MINPCLGNAFTARLTNLQLKTGIVRMTAHFCTQFAPSCRLQRVPFPLLSLLTLQSV